MKKLMKVLSIFVMVMFLFGTITIEAIQVQAIFESKVLAVGVSKEEGKSTDMPQEGQSFEDSLMREDPLSDKDVPKRVEIVPSPSEECKDKVEPFPIATEERKEKVESLPNEKPSPDGFEGKELHDEFMPGEVLVSFHEPMVASSLSELLPNKKIIETEDIYKSVYDANKNNASVDKKNHDLTREKIGKTYLITLSDKSEDGVWSAIETLLKNPLVKYAEPNYIAELCGTPNDYSTHDLWGMARIQAPQAWDTFTGTNLKIGVLDTGMTYNHPDLQDNVDTSIGFNCALGSNTDILDYDGHGTHVAGTIAAKGNNGMGVVGVNWTAKLVPIKICVSNTDSTSNRSLMLKAIEHAKDNKIPICNLSYGVGTSTSTLIEAVRDYGESGGLLVICAHNAARNLNNDSTYTSYAALDNVIIVGSSSRDSGDGEALSSFSNYGNPVHITAPGESITSTHPTGYKTYSGTSMSAPHVAGVAALIKARYPSITPVEIRRAIMEGADFVPKIAGEASSSGRLNAYRAVNRIANPSHLVVQPNNVEELGDTIIRSLGFKSASDIRSIKLIGNAVIKHSPSLRTVLPNLTYVDVSTFMGELSPYAFASCPNLTTVILQSDNVKLPERCFINCVKLRTIFRANNNPGKTLGEADFTGLITVSDIALGVQCFRGCTSLTTLRMPNAPKTRLAESAFMGCSNLTVAYLDTHPKVAGEADLTEISEIGPSAFKGTGFSAIKLPKNTNIGSGAFQDCTKLKSIQVHPAQTTTTSIGSQAFYNVNAACEVFMNQGLYGMSSFVFPRAVAANIPKRINSLVVRPITNEKMGEAIRVYLGSNTASSIKHLVVMGSAVMGDAASDSASMLPNLETADLSSFTGTIGDHSFYNCARLKTVIRNANLTSVPMGCFADCGSLRTIFEGGKYPRIWGEADLTDLSGGVAVNTGAFSRCTSLTTLQVPSLQFGIAGSFNECTSLSTIYRSGYEKVPDVFDLKSVSTLWVGWGHNFMNTRAKTVRLPHYVDIAEKAFFNCAMLERVEFYNAQASVVAIGSEAFYNVKSTCEAYMNWNLVYNSAFQIPRSATANIPKKLYW